MRKLKRVVDQVADDDAPAVAVGLNFQLRKRRFQRQRNVFYLCRLFVYLNNILGQIQQIETLNVGLVNVLLTNAPMQQVVQQKFNLPDGVGNGSVQLTRLRYLAFVQKLVQQVRQAPQCTHRSP